MTLENIPFIPNYYRLVFIAEGAANAIYGIHPSVPPLHTPQEAYIEHYSETTPPPSIIDIEDEEGDEEVIDESVFDNKLLRLRKDLPTTIPVFEAQQLWERLVKPLFKANQLVNQELVRLGPGDIVNKLNLELSLQENTHNRQEKRAGIYLAKDDYGLLVTAMVPQGSGDAEIYEFKPKWLTQSPSAPPKSIRCRTCALTALRNSQHTNASLEDPLKSYCPLDLISKNPSDILYATKLLLPQSSPIKSERFARFLNSNPLLPNLRDIQARLDNHGPLNADANDENFRVAMTLRDCSVFVRFPEDERDDDVKIEARLGDLDVKSAEKGPAWKIRERELIDGGWYTGTEGYLQQEISCALGRKFRTRDRI